MRQVRRSPGQWSTRTFDHRAVLTAVVVDDQELVADSVAAALDTAGLEAHPVYSGPAAVASCAMLRPQLVLLDISMPQQDGFVTAAILRRTQAARDVIITPTPHSMRHSFVPDRKWATSMAIFKKVNRSTP
ncbi:response regulator [Caballeronia sp. GAWG1-1]|uniref:response regulator n=1 Tax=Caballeronia sp. GAWG1-1 TaxID=2921742 RepID=UPI0032EC0BF8